MRHLFSILFLICTMQLGAQQFSTTWLKEAAPRNIGPGGMSGRITSIDVVESNPDIMYVGTASGGLWKSISAGISWEPVFNDQVTASVGAVAIQQSNPALKRRNRQSAIGNAAHKARTTDDDAQ